MTDNSLLKQGNTAELCRDTFNCTIMSVSRCRKLL